MEIGYTELYYTYVYFMVFHILLGYPISNAISPRNTQQSNSTSTIIILARGSGYEINFSVTLESDECKSNVLLISRI